MPARLLTRTTSATAVAALACALGVALPAAPAAAITSSPVPTCEPDSPFFVLGLTAQPALISVDGPESGDLEEPTPEGQAPAPAVVVAKAVDDPDLVAAASPLTTVLPVLDNDEGDATLPLGWSTVTEQGGCARTDWMSKELEYTPAPGFAGVDVFQYVLSSGSTATATVTVAAADPLLAETPGRDGATDDLDGVDLDAELDDETGDPTAGVPGAPPVVEDGDVVVGVPGPDAELPGPTDTGDGDEEPLTPAPVVETPVLDEPPLPTGEAPSTSTPPGDTTPAQPAPVVPAPAAPAQPAPAAPAPAAPAPVQPAPVQPAPAAPAPEQPAPEQAEAPVTTQPVVPAPQPPADQAELPVTAAPVTPAPAPVAPVVEAPALQRGVAGHAVHYRGTASPGSTVELWGYTRPSTTFRQVATTTADDAGRWSFPVAPAASSRYYVEAGGEQSGSFVLQVQQRVALAVRSAERRTMEFSGVVRPGRAGQEVRLYRSTPRGPVHVGTTWTEADGSWSYRRSFLRGGTFSFRALLPGGTDNLPASSSAARATVS